MSENVKDSLEIVVPNPLWTSHYKNGEWTCYTWVNGKKVFLTEREVKK